MAIQTSFPGCPLGRWSQGPVVWRSWMTGSRTKPKITSSSGMTLSLNLKLKPSWEHWNPKKTVTQSKFLRPGLRAPVRQHSNSTPIAKNAPKPDLARLAGRTWCYHCREAGQSKKHCQRKRVQAPGNDAGVRTVFMRSGVACNCRRPLSPRITFGETGVRGTLETPEQNEANEGDQSDAEVLAVPDTRVMRKN